MANDKDDISACLNPGDLYLNFDKGLQQTRQQRGGSSNQQINVDTMNFLHTLAASGVGFRAEPPTKPSHNVPFRRDPLYVDRPGIVKQIETLLSRQSGRAALVGLGGVGKSQLAIEYCHRIREQTRDTQQDTWVFWIHANTAERFEQGVRDIARLIKLPGLDDARTNPFELLRDWLREERERRWLVVLDQVDDGGFLRVAQPRNRDTQNERTPSLSLYECFPVVDHGMILITTRSNAAARKLLKDYEIIRVPPMNRDEALHLLNKRFESHSDNVANAALVKALDYMPLAISQAATYLNRKGSRCSVRQYLTKLRNSDILNSEPDDQRPEWVEHAILLTWRVSFEHVENERPSAIGLLSLMSLCDGRSIPRSLLRKQDNAYEQARSEEENDSFSGFTDGANDGDDAPSDACALADSDFDDDLDILVDYCLIQVMADPNTFQMHQLVQRATRTWLEKREMYEQSKATLVKNLHSVFPAAYYENRSACRILFPHAIAASENKPENKAVRLQWASLMYYAGWFAGESGLLAEPESVGLLAASQKMCFDCMNVRVEALGLKHPETLRAMCNLAATYRDQKRLAEAEKLERKASDAMSSALGREHRDTLTAISSLAVTLSMLSRDEEAMHLKLEVVKARSQVLGEEHLDTLRALGNLAVTYRTLGQWKEAEDIQVRVKDARLRLLSDAHPDTLSAISSLRVTYLMQSRKEEAEELKDKLVKAGQKHELLAVVESLERQVVEALSRVLGEDHCITLKARIDLAKGVLPPASRVERL